MMRDQQVRTSRKQILLAAAVSLGLGTSSDVGTAQKVYRQFRRSKNWAALNARNPYSLTKAATQMRLFDFNLTGALSKSGNRWRRNGLNRWRRKFLRSKSN